MRALFDRITEPLNYERWDEASALRQTTDSVRRELIRLLNGRSYFSGYLKPGLTHTILDYGLSDMVSESDCGGRHMEQVADKIKGLILDYEPRLKNIETQVERDPRKHSFIVRINALLRFEERAVQFVFPIAVTA